LKIVKNKRNWLKMKKLKLKKFPLGQGRRGSLRRARKKQKKERLLMWRARMCMSNAVFLSQALTETSTRVTACSC
jgi:hypothetical protein